MRPDHSYARALLGKQLCGKWHLVRILGSGGMSTVFEGLHRNSRRAAIKVLHPELAASRRVRSRFQREAYVANRVDHPDAVSVIDDDISDDGLVFLVMEYLEGETLGGRLKRAGAPLAPAQVITAALAVLDVLAVAHRNGVIHRDVKPDNIFLTRHERRIKLLDFGIASLRELSAATSDATGTGTTLGTPAFMAPEQARARTDEIDVTTDLWGLGATMFTLLAGRFVHEGVNATELLIAAATRPAPSLGSVADGLDGGLAAVVDRALAFEKSARWPDAPSMRTALRALRAQATEEVFGSDSFPPLACEQNTQDESNAAAGRTPMLIEGIGRWLRQSSRAKGWARLLYSGQRRSRRPDRPEPSKHFANLPPQPT
jgi:serine/threonine protein kinase